MLPWKCVASIKGNKERCLKISYTKEKDDRKHENTFETKLNGMRFVEDVRFSLLGTCEKIVVNLMSLI